jgi:hypothetical protein
MTTHTRNLERQNSYAQLEGTQGMTVTLANEIPMNCDICKPRKLCETIMQEESHAVLPGSRLCALIQGIKT